MKKRLHLLPVAAAVAGSLLLSGCTGDTSGNPTTASRTAARSVPVSVRLETDIDTLDPQRTITTEGYSLSYALYDRLVDLNAEGEIVPYLAKSWNTDGAKTVFDVRQDAVCTDGQVLTASDIAASLNRIATASPSKARQYFGGAPTSIVGDNGAGTVTITLSKPFSDLLRGLSQSGAGIICPSGLQSTSNLGTTPAGSGPYQLTTASTGSQYVLTTRENYTWGPGGLSVDEPGFPKSLTFQIVPSRTTAVNQLLSGGLTISSVTGTELSRVSKKRSLFHITAQPWGTPFLVFNQANATFRDENTRKALIAAIDRNDYLRASQQGQGAVAQWVLPADGRLCKAQPATMAVFDVDAAKRNLAAAGWKQDGAGKLTRDGQRLNIKIVALQKESSGAQYLAAQWESLGVTVDQRVVDTNAMTQIIFKGGEGWDAVVFPSDSPMPSSNNITNYVTGPTIDKGGQNVGSVDNSVVTEKSAAALTATDPNEACADWMTAHQALLDAADTLPLYVPETAWFGNNVTFTPYASNTLNPLSIRTTAGA